MAEEQSSGCSPESCSSCAHAGSCSSAKKDLKAPANPYSQVKKVIGVVSGKGGVGKSMVTASLARMMVQQGYAVGILDADITSPLQMTGSDSCSRSRLTDMIFVPSFATHGNIPASLPTALPCTPYIFGIDVPVIAGVVTQFWTDVMWGDLDFLFVDMPPGTGDVPLTVFQSLPVDGVVIVTSPQDLVQMIVEKAYNMAKKMNIPVLGLVENYSYLECPDCGKKISVFGESHIDEIAEKLGVEVLGKMPIDPKLAEIVEQEKFYEADNQYLKNIIDKFN